MTLFHETNAHRIAVVALALAAGACSEAPRPNLLLLAVDTLRADHLGAYGYDRPTSPAIDRFAESAVVFEEAHSSSAWTLPAFATLMTSTYTSTHRCWNYRSRLDPSFVTLAEELAAAGYHTSAVVSHTLLGSRYGLKQGFQDYDESLVRKWMKKSHEAITSPVITEKGLAILDRHAGSGSERPWFLWLHYFDPHEVYQRHAGHSDGFAGSHPKPIDLYDGEIAFTDEHIGRVLERLEELGLAENTVVALVSDHGEEFRDHQRRGHGRTLHREVERVPFAVRAPGIPPRRVTDPVSLVDFKPTMLELLGVPASSEAGAGRSVVDLMRGRPLEPRGFLMELRLRVRKVDVDAYVHDGWKLIVERPLAANEKPVTMLFDLRADPLEEHDVSSRHPEVVADLTERMARTVATAARASVAESEDLDLSEQEIESLRALGYVGDEPVRP